MSWCHECEKEFDKGIERCPICGDDLYEDIPPSMMEPADISWGFKRENEENSNWPVNEKGEPEEAVFLTKVTGTETKFNLMESLLRGCGIPVRRDYPHDGRFMRILFGFAGTGAALYVPGSMLEDARAIIAESEKVQED